MEKSSAAARPPSKERRRSVREDISLFSFKALATTLGGALLTLLISIVQTTYSDHLEGLRREFDHGAEFQTRLLAITGQVQNELAATNTLVRQDNFAGARHRNDHELADAFRQWETNALLLRNQGAQIYGPTVAAFIYDPGSALFSIDQCSILRAPGQAGGGENCFPRRHAEARSLDALIAQIEHGADPRPAAAPTRAIMSFQFNALAARLVLDRLFECASEARATRMQDPLCQNLEDLRVILDDRVTLAGRARLDLANAIMAKSMRRD